MATQSRGRGCCRNMSCLAGMIDSISCLGYHRIRMAWTTGNVPLLSMWRVVQAIVLGWLLRNRPVSVVIQLNLMRQHRCTFSKWPMSMVQIRPSLYEWRARWTMIISGLRSLYRFKLSMIPISRVVRITGLSRSLLTSTSCMISGLREALYPGFSRLRSRSIWISRL